MNTTTTIKVKKVRGPYGSRKPKTLIVVEDESQPESEVEPEVRESTEDEANEDTQSTISTITEEVEEDPEEEGEEELELPVLPSDPVLLRAEILNLQVEVVRLTKINQDLQAKLEGEKKRPKEKAEKAEKKEGKREIKRAKRPSDYAEKYLQKGQVLRWEHKARHAWGEATYIGDNKFIGKFSFKPEGEYPEEFQSLNAVAGVMLKHLTLRSLNAWSAFKNLDGTSVENIDLQATA